MLAGFTAMEGIRHFELPGRVMDGSQTTCAILPSSVAP